MSEQNLVPVLLNLITPSSKHPADEEWDLTLRFADQHRQDDLAEIIFVNTPASTEPWKVGALIDHLVWNISDESLERMINTLENWLRGDDPRRISYALAMDYVFPFKDPKEMFEVFTEVKSNFPAFCERCDELIHRRAKLRKNKTEK